MPAVRTVLVIGGGVAGAATAILLAEQGVTVDLVEIKPEIDRVGSGITLQGNALRQLRELGVWDAVQASGYAFDGLRLRAPDPHGTLIVELTEMRTGGPDLPATLGMNRPELARILLDRAADVGVKVRLGTTFSTLEQDDDGVLAAFTDASSTRYDLAVGADGVHSPVRHSLGIDCDPQPLGMGIWRIQTPRPGSVTRTDLFYGGSAYIAGYCPTGPDSIYAYLVEDLADRAALSPQEQLAVVRGLAATYHGPWDDITPLITDPTRINYARFEWHLLPRPWHRGRVVLIGDAAHSCPPTVAQGAAQALEDAAVLVETLLAHDTLDVSLWDEFMDRRHARAATVVNASVQLARWQLDHDPDGDVPGLMATVTQLVSTPA
jgi:2-polyprenyl-6-methoxyphenol hydroxylase-like FAD-dependent oxidoreductase